MITDFAHAPLYIAFTHGLGPNSPPARVVGPFRVVRWGAKGIWAYGDPAFGDAIPEAVRIATQAIGSFGWEVDGFDDPPWITVQVISPPPGTTARDIEADFASYVIPLPERQ